MDCKIEIGKILPFDAASLVEGEDCPAFTDNINIKLYETFKPANVPRDKHQWNHGFPEKEIPYNALDKCMNCSLGTIQLAQYLN